MNLTGNIELTEAFNAPDDSNYMKCSFQCFATDVDNLPTEYIAAGSICQVLDTKKVLQFHAKTSTWYEL